MTEDELKPLLTKEFLDVLVQAAKVVGWGVDFIEVRQFVIEVYEIAGVVPPEIEPHNF